MFNKVKKPGIVNDPIINSPISTDIPINRLFVPLMYLLITPIKITNAKKIKNETNVLPEKKPSAINDTNAFCIDISSGVEKELGIKDSNMIKEIYTEFKALL